MSDDRNESDAKARHERDLGSATAQELGFDHGISRRLFLFGGATATLAGCMSDEGKVPRGPLRSPGSTLAVSDPPRQAGIVTPPPVAAIFAALDVRAPDPDGLAGLLGALTRRIRSPGTTGSGAADPTVTLAVGASLFDSRFGLGALRPRRLAAMPSFPNDALDPAWCHGDLLVQVCAKDRATVRRAFGDLIRAGGDRLRVRRRIEGFRPGNAPDGRGSTTTRNLFGFREGAGNPDVRDSVLMDRLVWVQPGGAEPAWTVGGSYQVVRLIRFATDLWDLDSVERQEDVIGRHKASGAPLAGRREDERFDYAPDPDGRITPLDAHIRRANPRTPATEASRILRRSYSYRRGRDRAGQRDEGLVFVCFQQDLERGFAAVQRRLEGEALARYVLPFGGGYFFALPGVAGSDGYLGEGLVRAAGRSTGAPD